MSIRLRKIITIMAFAGFIIGLLIGAAIASKYLTKDTVEVESR